VSETQQEADQLSEDAISGVSRNLSSILEMHAALIGAAIAHGSNADVPGGTAMLAMGHVANMEAWENLQDASERLDRAYTSIEDEDPDDAWSAAQTIQFWAEQWRIQLDADYEMRRSIRTEANFLRSALAWAWSNEPRWTDFAHDITAAKTKLENILLTGRRPAFRGVPCMYEECKGKRLVRTTVPARGPHGEKTWRLTDWHCPSCKRSWNEDAYARLVAAASESLHYRNLDGEAWCSIERAAQRVDRSQATIRSWINRNQVTSACSVETRRTYVLISDIHRRHALALERAARRKRAMKRKRMTGV
jgi:hypothetical protein